MKLLDSKSAAKTTSAPLPTVVLVHGIFRGHRSMRRLREAFAQSDRKTLAPDLRPNDGSAGIAELAGKLAAYLETNLPPGERCDLVGHSMGGLVARAYVQQFGRHRVRRLVTLAAPHQGSLLAWMIQGDGAHDLRPGSPFLRDLARGARRLEAVRAASFWTPYDLIIVPPQSSLLPVGRNFREPLPHHRAFVTHKRFARKLVSLLSQP